MLLFFKEIPNSLTHNLLLLLLLPLLPSPLPPPPLSLPSSPSPSFPPLLLPACGNLVFGVPERFQMEAAAANAKLDEER